MINKTINKQNRIIKNKGITLIALVITIIVMLILVAVTITMVVNGGLFSYAEKAAKDTESEMEKEKKITELESGLSTDELIEEFSSKHSWTRVEDTFTCSHCNASYTMGDKVVYSPNTEKTQTTVYATDSGYAEDQTISKEDFTWIVLGLDKDGTLLITTAGPSHEMLTLQGSKTYTNGPSILNNVCKELYSNTTYGKARSINVDDINLALEYTDTRGMVFAVSGNEYRVNKGTKFGDVGTDQMLQTDWDAIKNNNQTPEEGKELTEYEINGYNYYVPELTNITYIRQSTILCPSWTSYWLASIGAIADSYNGFAEFGIGEVYVAHVHSSGSNFESNGSGSYHRQGFRPVVPLKNELPPLKVEAFNPR